jgi:hypothetical protein
MNPLKAVKYRVPAYKPAKTLVSTDSPMPNIPLLTSDEQDNYINNAVEKGWDLLLYHHPSSMRLINTKLVEQALILNQYPNPSLVTIQSISDTSSIRDLCQGLFLEGYKLVYAPNLAFGRDWRYCDRALHVDSLQDSYPNVLYPLARFRRFTFKDRLECALKICAANRPVIA